MLHCFILQTTAAEKETQSFAMLRPFLSREKFHQHYLVQPTQHLAPIHKKLSSIKVLALSLCKVTEDNY
jgi:hypothetical protein